jgi:uracil phosphoribosyltransferase
MAVEVLMNQGVPEDKILFLNLIASPQGIENFAKRYPKLRIITAFIDEGLDDHKYVLLHIMGEGESPLTSR